MDRAFTLNAPPEAVWPSVVPARDAACGMVSTEAVERFVPRRRRAVRSLNVTWRSLVVGDVIPNYGGRGETFEVAAIEAPSTLVYDRPRKMNVSWSITLTPTPTPESTAGPRNRRGSTSGCDSLLSDARGWRRPAAPS